MLTIGAEVFRGTAQPAASTMPTLASRLFVRPPLDLRVTRGLPAAGLEAAIAGKKRGLSGDHR